MRTLFNVYVPIVYVGTDFKLMGWKFAFLEMGIHGEKVSEEVAILAVQKMVEINYWGRGNFEIPALEAMLEGLRMQGSWEGPIDWDDVVNTSFLPADLQ